MEQPPVTVESVRNLQPNGKRVLEDLLGRSLEEHQQVFIMVLSPGTEPDDEARRKARAALEATFHKTASYAEEHGVSDEEIEAAIAEARKDVRSMKG